MPNLVFFDDAVWAWLDAHPEIDLESFDRLLTAPAPSDRALAMYSPPVYETDIFIHQTSKVVVEYTIRSPWDRTPTLLVTRIRGPISL